MRRLKCCSKVALDKQKKVMYLLGNADFFLEFTSFRYVRSHLMHGQFQ